PAKIATPPSVGTASACVFRSSGRSYRCLTRAMLIMLGIARKTNRNAVMKLRMMSYIAPAKLMGSADRTRSLVPRSRTKPRQLTAGAAYKTSFYLSFFLFQTDHFLGRRPASRLEPVIQGAGRPHITGGQCPCLQAGRPLFSLRAEDAAGRIIDGQRYRTRLRKMIPDHGMLRPGIGFVLIDREVTGRFAGRTGQEQPVDLAVLRVRFGFRDIVTQGQHAQRVAAFPRHEVQRERQGLGRGSPLRAMPAHDDLAVRSYRHMFRADHLVVRYTGQVEPAGIERPLE